MILKLISGRCPRSEVRRCTDYVYGYWQTPIDTKGQQMYGAPIHIFTQPEILQAIELAEQCGFALSEPIDLSCSERVVHWEQAGLDYTFLILTLRKSS